MKLSAHYTFSMAILSAALLSACGGSSGGSVGSFASDVAQPATPPGMQVPSDPPAATSTPLSGRVIDGYVSGATVCLDVNANRVCENAETRVTSSTQGAYSIVSNGVGNLVGVDGTNTDTMSANQLILLTPATLLSTPNTRQLTPVTTLASVLAGQNATAQEYVAAAGLIKQGFGLDPSYDLYRNDPIARANDVNLPTDERNLALGVHKFGVQVANTVITSMALDNLRDASAQNTKFAAIAALLARRTGAPDLTSEAQLRQVLDASSSVAANDAQVRRLAVANGAVQQAPTTAAVGMSQNTYVTTLATDPSAGGTPPDNSNTPDDVDMPTDGDGNGIGPDAPTPAPEMPDMPGAFNPADFLSPTALCAIPVLGDLLISNVFSALPVPGFSELSCDDAGAANPLDGLDPSAGGESPAQVITGPLSDALCMIPVLGEPLVNTGLSNLPGLGFGCAPAAQ